jgi:hypothetical protein
MTGRTTVRMARSAARVSYEQPAFALNTFDSNAVGFSPTEPEPPKLSSQQRSFASWDEAETFLASTRRQSE